MLDEAALLWPLFALMQPLNGAVFALDGILIGASDGPFLALSMVAAFCACAPSCSRRSRATGASAACGRRSSSSSSSRLALMTTRFRRAPLARHRVGVAELSRVDTARSSGSRAARTGAGA